MSEPAASTERGEQTRRLIVDTAIRLFGELGYEKTTMRAIASAAGVSVGNAYYYFPSKDALVSEFYLQLQREHVARVEPLLAEPAPFGQQLRDIFLRGLEVWSPYHQFAGRFIGIAAVPGSPVSPLSPQSAAARQMSTGIFRRFAEQTTLRMDPAVREELPDLLWLLQLALVVFWVHDSSQQQRRTRLVIQQAVPYLEDLVGLSRLKVMRPVTERGLALLKLINIWNPNPPHDRDNSV